MQLDTNPYFLSFTMSIADIAPGSDQLTDWETKSSKTHQLDSDCSFRTLKLQAQLFITLNPYLTQEIVLTLAHAHTGQLFQKKNVDKHCHR